MLCGWKTLSMIYLCQIVWFIFLCRWRHCHWRYYGMRWLYLLLVIILSKSISSYKLSVDNVPLPILCIFCFHLDTFLVSYLLKIFIFGGSVNCKPLGVSFCWVNLCPHSPINTRHDTNIKWSMVSSINNRWIIQYNGGYYCVHTVESP